MSRETTAFLLVSKCFAIPIIFSGILWYFLESHLLQICFLLHATVFRLHEFLIFDSKYVVVFLAVSRNYLLDGHIQLSTAVKPLIREPFFFASSIRLKEVIQSCSSSQEVQNVEKKLEKKFIPIYLFEYFWERRFFANKRCCRRHSMINFKSYQELLKPRTRYGTGIVLKALLQCWYHPELASQSPNFKIFVFLFVAFGFVLNYVFHAGGSLGIFHLNQLLNSQIFLFQFQYETIYFFSH